MQVPAQRSPLASPAIAFIALVSIALGFGAVNELVFVSSGRGSTIQLVTGIFGAVVSALMLISAAALWRSGSGARRLAIATAVLTLAFCAYVVTPGNRVVGMLALLLSLLASGVLIWVAQRGIGASTATSM